MGYLNIQDEDGTVESFVGGERAQAVDLHEDPRQQMRHQRSDAEQAADVGMNDGSWPPSPARRDPTI